MSSDINPINIDTDFPVAGQDQSSEGFRQNFTAIAQNLGVAQREISDLQAKVVLKQNLIGQVLNNDLNGTVIKSATMRDMRLDVYPITGVSTASPNIVLDPGNGPYQYISLTAGSYNLDILPGTIDNTSTTVFLEISADAGTEIIFPNNTSRVILQGLNAITGMTPATSTLPNPTLYINTNASRSAGRARVLSFVYRQVVTSGADSAYVTVSDISDLQSRVFVGAPANRDGVYIGSPGDTQGDIRITPTEGQMQGRMWWCGHNYDANNSNSIWYSVIGSDRDLGPQGVDGSVQYADLANGMFAGSSSFYFQQPTLIPGTSRSQGNLRIGDAGALTRVDVNVWGNLNFFASSTNQGNINIANGGMIYGNITGQVIGNLRTVGNGVVISGNSITAQNLNLTSNSLSLNSLSVTEIRDIFNLRIQNNQFNLIPGGLGAVTNDKYWTMAVGGPAGNNFTVADVGPVVGVQGGIQYYDGGGLRRYQFSASNTFVINNGDNNQTEVLLRGNLSVNQSNAVGSGRIIAQGNITAQGNLQGSYLLGNGRFISDLNEYGNSNVADFLPTYTGNISGANVNLGNGYLNALGVYVEGRNALYSNTDVQLYLPFYSGRIGNLDLSFNSDISGVRNFLADGSVNLGDAGNLTLYGGSPQQVLTSDGGGGVYWSTPTGGGGGGGGSSGAPGSLQLADGFGNFTSNDALRFESNGGGDYNFTTGNTTFFANNIIANRTGQGLEPDGIIYAGDIYATGLIYGNLSGGGLGTGPVGAIQINAGSSNANALTFESGFTIEDGVMSIVGLMANANVSVSGANLNLSANNDIGGNLNAESVALVANLYTGALDDTWLDFTFGNVAEAAGIFTMNNITAASPAVVTANAAVVFTPGASVSFYGIEGTPGNQWQALNEVVYFCNLINYNQFEVFTDADLTIPLDTSSFTDTYTANSGTVIGNTQGILSPGLTFVGSEYVQSNLTVRSSINSLDTIDGAQIRSSNVTSPDFFVIPLAPVNAYLGRTPLFPYGDYTANNEMGGNIMVPVYSNIFDDTTYTGNARLDIKFVWQDPNDYSIKQVLGNTQFRANQITHQGNITASGQITAGRLYAETEANISIGGGVSGYYLRTDGSGGLSWAPVSGGSGSASYVINDITKADPAVITTTTDHSFVDGGIVVFIGVSGTDAAWAGLNNQYYYVDVIDSTNFSIYSDQALTTGVDTTGFGGAYTADSGNVMGVTTANPGGGNTSVQFNDGGLFAGSTSLQWNKATSNLTVTGNITATANIAGSYLLGNGRFLTGLAAQYSNSNVAAYLPTYTGNLASLTGNVTTTANVNASNLSVSSNVHGNNAFFTGTVTANNYQGNFNVTDFTTGNLTVTIEANIVTLTAETITTSRNFTLGNITLDSTLFADTLTASVNTLSVLGNVSTGNVYSSAGLELSSSSDGITITADNDGLGIVTVNSSQIVVGNLLNFNSITLPAQPVDEGSMAYDGVSLYISDGTSWNPFLDVAGVRSFLGSNSNVDLTIGTGVITTQGNITTSGNINAVGNIYASANLHVANTIIANNIVTTGIGNTLISSGAILTLRAGNGVGLINAEATSMNFTGRVIGNLVSTTAAPSSSTDTGSAGQIAVDADYIYICVATNTWKRAALSTW